MRPEFTKKPEFMLHAAEQKRNAPPLLVELLIFLAVFTAGSMATGMLGSIPMLAWLFTGDRMHLLLQSAEGGSTEMLETFFALMEQMPSWITMLVLVLNFLLGVVAAFYCKIFEKRKLPTMGLVKGCALRSYGLGALLGAVSFSAVLGLAAAFGGLRITGMSLTVSMLPSLLLLLVCFVLQSAGEELLVRGYLMTSLSKRYRLPVCVGMSAVVFGLLHVSNPGVNFVAFLNIVLVGVVLGLYMLLTGDIWGACGYHALWNFCQGSVFGVSVSGLNTGTSVFTAEITGHSDLLTGGDFGLEGSLCTTFVMLATIGILVFFLSRRAPDPVDPEPPEEI